MGVAYYKQKTKEELQDIVNNSNTWQEVMYNLGYTANRGNSYNKMKNHLKELNIDTSKLDVDNKYRYSHPKYSLEELLVENSTYTNMTKLKDRILKAGLLEIKCAICGITNWNNMPLVLQLDHINGNNRDNRIENLRLLCPNCHSQTETFSGKNATRYLR